MKLILRELPQREHSILQILADGRDEHHARGGLGEEELTVRAEKSPPQPDPALLIPPLTTNYSIFTIFSP